MKKSKTKEPRRIQSFNLSDRNIEKMKDMAQTDGLNRSEWLNRIVATEYASRQLKEDLEAGIQTTLEIHTMSAAHRAARKDGKCNPNSMNGKCKVCWS